MLAGTSYSCYPYHPDYCPAEIPAFDDTRRDLANRLMYRLVKIACWPLIVQNCLIRLAPPSLVNLASSSRRSQYVLAELRCMPVQTTS